MHKVGHLVPTLKGTLWLLLKNPKGLAPTTYAWESLGSYAAFTHGVKNF